MRSTVFALGLLVLPLLAQAVEVEFGLTGRAAWESNVFRAPNDEESDFSGAIGPVLAIRERSRSLDLALDYRMLYEEFVELSGLGSFEHFLTSRAEWRPTARDTFRLDQELTRTDSLLQLVQTGVTGLATTTLVPERETITRHEIGGGYRRVLSPLWELAVSGDNQVYWYESPIRSDSVSTTLSADVTRLLSPRQRLGAGFAAIRQDFDETELTNGSGTTFAQVYGLWAYELGPKTSFSASIGPRLAIPDDLEDSAPAPVVPVRRTAGGSVVVSPAGCPAFAPGVVRLDASCAIASTVRVDPSSIAIRDVDFLEGREQPDENIGFFGRVAVVRRWDDQVSTTLSYQRSASAASGLAASTDLDVVSLRADWRPRRSWRIVAIVAWERQVSASEVPRNELLLSTTPTTLFVDAQGRIVADPALAANVITNAAQVVGLRTAEFVDNALDYRTTRFELRAQHDITPRITLAGLATWWSQDTQGDFQADETTTAARIELSLTWRFAPIGL